MPVVAQRLRDLDQARRSVPVEARDPAGRPRRGGPGLDRQRAAIRERRTARRDGEETGDFSLAERHFRRAVELHPRDGEAWLGLAASYDRLRRFDLADRAYDQAIKISGPTAEILNNRGYSYVLRGDHQRARQTLLEAQAKDPGNSHVKNNLELLEASVRKAKATQ
jgi:tetratricopeptide (TPR) repeat protein